MPCEGKSTNNDVRNALSAKLKRISLIIKEMQIVIHEKFFYIYLIK